MSDTYGEEDDEWDCCCLGFGADLTLRILPRESVDRDSFSVDSSTSAKIGLAVTFCAGFNNSTPNV